MRTITLIILIFGLVSCGNVNNVTEYNETNSSIVNQNNGSKYHSDQCPKGQMMGSWDKYSDGNIRVNNCIDVFTCPAGKKMTTNCGDLFEYISCTTLCIGENDVITEGF